MARAASDFNGLTLEISLTGAVETSRTVPVQENAVVMFDSLPVGGTVRIKAKVWRQSAKFGTIICCEGISEPITIQQGENSHVFPLSMLSSVLPLTLEAAAAGTITITNPWTTLKYTINGGALTAVPSDGGMFKGCTGLTAAPELPATELADYCCYCMFDGCTGLVFGPVLPAAELVDSCYYQMFYGCTSLKTLTCLATARTANNALSNWVYNVPEGGTFYKAAGAEWTAPASALIYDTYPWGWTVLDYSGD